MALKNFLKRHLSTALLILGIFMVRWSLAEPYHVPTPSMVPTIMPGDRIVANKLAYGFRLPFTNWKPFGTTPPKHGDIIVFKYPLNPSVNFVKRLIGVPGDHIEIESGFVKVNGQFIAGSETALQNKPDATGLHYQEKYGEHQYTVQRLRLDHKLLIFEVPAGSYFFMGDNRDNSNDSRYWGFVPEENLLGKAAFGAFNFRFENYLPNADLHRIFAFFL